MKNDLINKIIDFFKEENYNTKIILRNSTLDYEYYVIYNGQEDIMLNDESYKKLIDFQKEKKTNILSFYKKNIKSKKGLLEEFKAEGYKIIYHNKT